MGRELQRVWRSYKTFKAKYAPCVLAIVLVANDAESAVTMNTPTNTALGGISVSSVFQDGNTDYMCAVVGV